MVTVVGLQGMVRVVGLVTVIVVSVNVSVVGSGQYVVMAVMTLVVVAGAGTVVTGRLIVQGQFVMVRVVAEVTVYVWSLYVTVVGAGQYVVTAVTTSVVQVVDGITAGMLELVQNLVASAKLALPASTPIIPARILKITLYRLYAEASGKLKRGRS
jgi:hypothetical protein